VGCSDKKVYKRYLKQVAHLAIGKVHKELITQEEEEEGQVGQPVSQCWYYSTQGHMQAECQMEADENNGQQLAVIMHMPSKVNGGEIEMSGDKTWYVDIRASII
jgi:hypothetical protein